MGCLTLSLSSDSNNALLLISIYMYFSMSVATIKTNDIKLLNVSHITGGLSRGCQCLLHWPTIVLNLYFEITSKAAWIINTPLHTEIS